MKLAISKKHIAISKANSSMLIFITTATIVTVFCLVSSKALLSKAAYQRRVINASNKAAKQLEANKKTADALSSQYQVFLNNSSATNIIGGKNTTSSTALPPDGDNARVVLDALPSGYDYPALISSLSKILSTHGVQNVSLGGTDQAATIDAKASANPQSAPITLTISGTSNFSSIKNIINDLERSIRPIDVTNLQLSGPENNMIFSINLTTYYQPAKALTIGSKEIK